MPRPHWQGHERLTGSRSVIFQDRVSFRTKRRSITILVMTWKPKFARPNCLLPCRVTPASVSGCAPKPRQACPTPALLQEAGRFVDLRGGCLKGGVKSYTPMMLSPGTKLGPYEILDRLGAGGMGE